MSIGHPGLGAWIASAVPLDYEAADGPRPLRSIISSDFPGEPAEFADASVRAVRCWLRLGLVNPVHFGGVIRIPREEYERVLREGIKKGNRVVRVTP